VRRLTRPLFSLRPCDQDDDRFIQVLSPRNAQPSAGPSAAPAPAAASIRRSDRPELPPGRSVQATLFVRLLSRRNSLRSSASSVADADDEAVGSITHGARGRTVIGRQPGCTAMASRINLAVVNRFLRRLCVQAWHWANHGSTGGRQAPDSARLKTQRRVYCAYSITLCKRVSQRAYSCPTCW
jgi:hypothetical protein